jgi:nucleotide-binding universal stress UspA family protein
MYDIILVTLDTTPTDRAVIEHIKPLAKLCGSKVILLHVADGWAARQFGKDAVSPEVIADRAYLENVRAEFAAEGIPAETDLAFGEPPREIIKWVREKQCALIAMSTHGHKFLMDLLLGTTANQVQHAVNVPVLLIRAGK